jgi:hypothetical protein
MPRLRINILIIICRPELEKKYGAKQAMIDSRTAMDRAQYLGEQIKEVCWEELGLAGQQLIEWLIEVLKALDPCPPPKGTYVHLLLDRYQREAQTVRRRIEHCCTNEGLGQSNDGTDAQLHFLEQLMNIVKHEVTLVPHMLLAVNAKTECELFNDSISTRYTDAILGKQFSEVRDLVVKTILNVVPGVAPSSCGLKALDYCVRQMVEESSGHLHKLLSERVN